MSEHCRLHVWGKKFHDSLLSTAMVHFNVETQGGNKKQ